MSPFRAERDMRFDYYFSDDILYALRVLDETDLGLTHCAEDERVRFFHRQGFELAIRKLAAAFGFSYRSDTVPQEPGSGGWVASPD
jgi:hypothetical protein